MFSTLSWPLELPLGEWCLMPFEVCAGGDIEITGRGIDVGSDVGRDVGVVNAAAFLKS